MDLKLLIASDRTTPLSVLAVAGLTAVSLTVEPSLASASQPVLVLPNGTLLHGTNVLRYLGRIATTIPTLYKRDAIETSQIDEWLDYARIFSFGSEYEGACKIVDGLLLHNTFLVGHSLSLADITIWSYLAEIAAVGDANMRDLKRGEIIQLERKGYFRCDVPFITPSKPIVLYAILDGRQTAPPK